MAKLVRTLQDGGPEERATAALKLAGRPDAGPEAVAALVARLDDVSPVREHAALALFGMDDPAATAALAPTVPPRVTASFSRYPPVAQENKLEGRVDMALLVSETGHVLHGRFTRRAAPELDRAALAAASHWEYEVQRNNGRARMFTAPAVFEFRGGEVHTNARPPAAHPVATGTAGTPASAPPVCPNPDTPPALQYKTKPEYPTEAARAHAQGSVVIELVISTTGEVENARVLESVPLLDAAALDCVREWRFRPAMKDGVAVRSLAQGVVTFRLFDSP